MAKMNFWDAGKKYSESEDRLRNMNLGCDQLTIYSLTPEGETEPTRLIIKLAYMHDGDNYLTLKRVDLLETTVCMAAFDYRNLYPQSLLSWCLEVKKLRSQGIDGKEYYSFFRHIGGKLLGKVTIREFFDFNPRRDEPGAQEFLRDKEFFCSLPLDQLLEKDWKKLVKKIDPSRAEVRGTHLDHLFDGYESITELDLSSFDTSKVWTMHSMFKNCKSLQRLNLSSFDTSGTYNMAFMFENCESLKRLDLSHFDFSSVGHMKGMFKGCTNLEEVIVSDTILRAGGVDHATGHKIAKYYSSWSGAHTPSQADAAGTLCYDLEDEIARVSFARATQEEQYKHLGLMDKDTSAPRAKLIIVPHKPPKKGRK